MSRVTVGPCPRKKCDGTVKGRSGEPATCGSCDYEYGGETDAIMADGGVEVPKQTETVDFQRAKAADTTSWSRAVDEDAEVQPDGALGHYRVTLGDGDNHETFLAQLDTGEWAGRCDCDAWSFHRHPDDDQLDLSLGSNERSHPCAHLCVLRQHEVVGPVECPTVPESVVSDLDVSVVDHAPDDDQDEAESDQEPSDDVVEPPTTDGGRDEPVETVAPATPDEEAVESHQEFVEEIAGVPSVFVVSMGRGGDAKPYVTKEGLNYLARKMGVETRAEPLSPSWEDDGDMAAYRGVAVDDEGRRYEDVATARAEQVESTVGRENLDELASTRATNRALRLATGCGYASAEEVDGSAGIDPDPETVAEVSD
jgi:hypothetical protein